MRDGVITGPSQKLYDGWVTLAGPRPHLSGANAALAVITEIRDNEGALIESYGPYYARNGAATVARPNLRVYNGWTARIVACGSTSFPSTGTAEGIVILSSAQPVGAGIIPPWEGAHNTIGDGAQVATADPAAGSNPAAITTGLRSREVYRSVAARLVTDATSGTRLVRVQISAQPAAVAPSGQIALQTNDYAVSLGNAAGAQGTLLGTPPDAAIGFAMPGVGSLGPGSTGQLEALGLQAGDNWGAATWLVARWAAFQ